MRLGTFGPNEARGLKGKAPCRDQIEPTRHHRACHPQEQDAVGRRHTSATGRAAMSSKVMVS
jgi:hypothetical protein